MSFEIKCPNCNQSLEAEEEMDGMEVECPGCNSPFTIKMPQVESPKIPELKECPYCGEDILAKAKKCKHCGEFLDDSLKPVFSEPQQSLPQKGSLPEKNLWKGHTSHMYYLGAHILWGIIGCLTLIGFLGNWICYLRAKSMKYKLSNKRISSEMGILSKQTAEVMIKDVRSVNLKQGIFERMFGLGTVEIGSAGTAGIEVSISGVSKPEQVKYLVTKLQNELL